MHRPHISWVKLQPHTGDFIHVYGGTTEMVLEHVLDKTASTSFCFKCFPDLLSINHYGYLLPHTNHMTIAKRHMDELFIFNPISQDSAEGIWTKHLLNDIFSWIPIYTSTDSPR